MVFKIQCYDFENSLCKSSFAVCVSASTIFHLPLLFPLKCVFVVPPSLKRREPIMGEAKASKICLIFHAIRHSWGRQLGEYAATVFLVRRARTVVSANGSGISLLPTKKIFRALKVPAREPPNKVLSARLAGVT